MKRRMQSITLFLLLIVTVSFAQVTEETKEMKEGAKNALVIEIAETNKNIAEDIWRDMIKKYRGKMKKKRKEEQWTIEKVRLSAITGQEYGTMYAQIEEKQENVVEFSLWVPNGEDYLSSENNSEGYASAEQLLEEYALEVRIATVEEEFKSKERILESHEKDLKKLKKDNDDYHKDIKDATKDIEDAEKGLVKNEESQKSMQEQLDAVEAVFVVANDTLRSMLREATSKDEEKSIKKMIKNEEGKVKDVEKALKGLKKDEKKMYKTIENSKDKIHQAEENIRKNIKDQERKEEEIAQQKAIVEEVSGRLDLLKKYRK